MASDNARELVKRSQRLFSRGSQESLWQVLAEQFYPERADFTSTFYEGEEFATHLFDSGPAMFRRDLGNAFSAMLRPRGQPWMRAGIADLELMDEGTRRQAQIFLDHVTAATRTHLYRRVSKFVRATKEADHDYATFGAAVLSAEVNADRSGLRYQNHHLRDCAWAEDHLGDVDTLHRKMKMSARQIRQMFQRRGDTLHEQITRCLEKHSGNPETKFEIRHIMMPVGDYEFERRKKPPRGATHASIYLDMANDSIIRESFAYEFRYVVPRWQTISGSVYPVSPAAMTALPDARMLQAMARVMLEAAEKQVDPPLTATQDAVIGDVNLAAAGITWVDRDYDERLGPALQPMDLGKNVRLGIDMLSRTYDQLGGAWYINKLNLPERGERTAYEMARRVEEYIRAAVPLFEPLETEYNAPLLELTAQILLRNGGYDLSLAPEDLARQEIEWAFQNPLQDALEKNKIFAAQSNMELIAGHAQYDDKVLADYDFRTSLREAVVATGCPAHWLRDRAEADEDIAEREEQAALAQAAQGVQMAGDAATAAGQGAQAVGGAVDLAAMMGGEQ